MTVGICVVRGKVTGLRLATTVGPAVVGKVVAKLTIGLPIFVVGTAVPR